MANHQSALKRIRSNEKRRLHNRYHLKTCRSLIKQLRKNADKQEGKVLFQRVSSMLDKLAKKEVIHKNKAAHDKSRLSKLLA